MRYFLPLLLGLSTLVVAHDADAEPTVPDGPSDVLSLTAADFESTVNSEPLILVEFFAPW